MFIKIKMKLSKGGIHKHHIKMFSEDLNKSSNTKNYFISNLLNKSGSKGINTEKIEPENFGNFKLNIQNIFSNDDKKKKAIQYVTKIRNERNKSPYIQQGEYYTLNKDINIENLKSRINKIKSDNNFRNEKRFDISSDKKDYKTLDYNFYDLYKDRTLNTNFYSNVKENTSKKKNNGYNINVNRRNVETIQSNYNDNNNYIRSSFMVNDKNTKNFSGNKNHSNNNVLKNYQNYGIYNDKKAKNYNMTKLKDKILNIPNQDEKYPRLIPQENQNQAMYNTQINFNYNTNKKYYVHKNLVYSKLNNPTSRVNDSNSKTSLLTQSQSKPRVKILNDNYNNNNFRNSNIIIEKIFNPKKLSIINPVYFTITTRRNRKYKYIDKNLQKFSKDKLIFCEQNELELINNKNNFKFNFKNETEMFNYIKNKYNDKKIKELLNLKKNEDKLNNLKEENNKLKKEIDNLQIENEQCKIELNDIRSQYNDLNKELNIAKEENEKLKDNFINNMIEDNNNEINGE